MHIMLHLSLRLLACTLACFFTCAYPVDDIPSSVLQKITVTTSSLSVAQGSVRQFIATGTYDDGSTQDITSSVTWTSSDTNVAMIDTAGLATALKEGVTNITASLVIISPPIELEVLASPVVSAISKSGTVNTPLAFNMRDFMDNFSNVPSKSLVKIKITALPTHGVLKIVENSVAVDQEIPVENLDSLTYVPNDGWNGTDNFWWVGLDECLYSIDEAPIVIEILAVPCDFDCWLNRGKTIATIVAPVISAAGTTATIIICLYKKKLCCFKKKGGYLSING